MPDYSIILTRRAKDDIIDIGDYITYTLLEPETARNFITGLRSAMGRLKELPERYPLVDDVVLASQGIHCMPYKNHYIFYEIMDMMKTVIILRVGHNRRNWKEILIK
ncbi:MULTISPECIES: type II toxin-antitoxin system RelE/ParE family toxin [Clostridia]|uniref:type II toxin-antitoxin system RelE/ParE family toxin n=1 Tax=Clostridia TaxID=186801 RepID=UPI00067F1229|nr:MULTISPECIES: type II toxin-antitoxin system RelE/ParE family toxin [Clostridia]